ncbi:CHAT domain-containing protein [Xanthomarina sp. F2636L]|uniref:CHAT domain-containing protein n=1 Tax=Xanthomarina sp. F2636L TaxID=2996018 RepID=UPI00225E6BC5|nr:CHAT domain-containing tetratricopeptide repeat protein [Xanthomarina sp. F2636L]MCX7550658.1 CHAT domain-containing protein [Xanthomarina sp. F2636L]
MRNILIIILVFISTPIIFAQENNHIKELDYNFDKAYEHYYTNKDSALYYINKVKEQAIKHHEIEYAIEALITENWAANSNYNLLLIKKNLQQLDSVLTNNSSYIETLDLYNYYKTANSYSKSLYEYELKDYKKALISFKTLVNDTEKIPDFKKYPNIFSLYLTANNFIAKIYSDEGQYKVARQYYEQNLRTIESHPEANLELANNIEILISELYQKEGRFEQANATILKNLSYHTSVSKNSNRIISSYQSVVNNCIHLKQMDSATFYLKKMKENLPKDHPFWYRYHEVKAKVYEVNNEYNLAEKELLTALELIKQKWQNQPHNEVAEIYNSLGNLNAKFKQPKKALEYYNLAIYQFSVDKTNSTINQTSLLKILKNKAEVLNNQELFSESMSTVNLALQTLDQLKPSFKSNADKLFLMAEAFPVFESGLEATYNLYQQSKQDSLIDKAFYYSEKSKSVLLLEAILGTKANKFANIPKQIIEKEQLLKSQINHIEKQLNKTKNKVLEDQLFEVKHTYRELITTIETEYKTYYDLKYNTEVISLSKLQNLLKPNDALVSYFYGNQAIYIITITKSSKSIEQYKIDNLLEDDIVSIYEMLNNPKSNLEKLTNKSFNLYKNLLAPSIENLSQQDLIIVADGLLNYIPFSSISTNGTSNYLIESHTISYVNSATLLNQLLEKEGINNKVLAFAPSFETSSYNSLLSLPNNQTEAEAVLNYFKGKTLTNNQATLNNFNLDGENYGLLHFATHAILNDETPEYSYLAFQPNQTKNNLLYVSDLYNLNLNTNLVTLSACESGIGDLKRGEGFISLARGFYFSGASSISSTLWKINDASALNIMDAFYRNLSKGKNKSLSLQQAQKSFIKANNQNALAHPYYWSGFVISGNTTAITSGYNWIWYLLIVAGIIIIGVVLKKKKNI